MVSEVEIYEPMPEYSYSCLITINFNIASLSVNIYVVVNFLSQAIFVFLLFLGMIIT